MKDKILKILKTKKPRVVRQKLSTYERVIKNKKIYNRKKESTID
jgi:hypothetical protein